MSSKTLTSTATIVRPDRHSYFLGLAVATSWRACCRGAKVGAVFVQEERVVATGYNGTPGGLPNCDEVDQACPRCNRHAAEGGRPLPSNLDLCICVHAEANGLIAAARFGIPLDGATLYCTHEPCLDCAKELAQARIAEIRFLSPYQMKAGERRYEAEVREAHRRLMMEFRGGIHPVSGLDALGACVGSRLSSARKKQQEHGIHSLPSQRKG